ncbi:MAG: STAS domain-containing protein [Hyphomicrobiaceae bacterium]|nr:STAS domain-containing protein [Hyphomicrobiaceae bacterium]
MTDTKTAAPRPTETVTPPTFDWWAYLARYTPKVVVAVREGYSREIFLKDMMAGLTVAILAVPLSLAIAIGSGVDPAKGLITAIVGGFFISAFGGCRLQVGGPAAAFIVIVAGVVAKYGVEGLVAATFMAGAFLVVAALLNLGTYIKYVPGPVILGFTCGLGVIIFVSQLKDFFGLNGNLATEFVHKLRDLWSIRATWNLSALAVGLASVAMIVWFRRAFPKLPGLLGVVVLSSAAVWLFGLNVETVGSRFGQMPRTLPAPTLPWIGLDGMIDLLPTALMLALLIGVESLLSAVTADAIAGTRHRPNTEILGQGIANMATALFGGLPATGVIARTGTNIAAGGQTPVSGIFHALFVLLFVMLLAPLVSYLALPCLAAVLLTVAWRLIEPHDVWHFLKTAPRDDAIVLLATMLLTIFIDLNVGISVGVVLASLFFMHRMSETAGDAVTALEPDNGLVDESGVKTLTFRGPLFFGQSMRVSDALRENSRGAKVLVLDFAGVPLVDATAISMLDDLVSDCRKRGQAIVIAGLQSQPKAALQRSGLLRDSTIHVALDHAEGLAKAHWLVTGQSVTT